MTGNDSPPTAGGGAEHPPLSLELLADLHAGVLDPEVADELRLRVEADPDAMEMLAALDATTASLSRLPQLTIPENVAARIDAALRDEAAARSGAPVAVLPARPVSPAAPAPAPSLVSEPVTAPVIDLGAARRRRRGLIAAGGLLTAAAAVIGVIAVSGLTGGQTGGSPAASATNPSDQVLPPLAVTSNNLADAFDDAMSVTDYGPLGAPGRLDACLAAIQVDPSSAKPLGAREVSLDGTPGVLLILPTGTAARFRLVVVEPQCGPDRSHVLADTIIGR